MRQTPVKPIGHGWESGCGGGGGGHKIVAAALGVGRVQLERHGQLRPPPPPARKGEGLKGAWVQGLPPLV